MNDQQQFIAYSLPGSTEYLLGTIRKMSPLHSGADIRDFDFVIAPFDKENQAGYLVDFSSIAFSPKFSCLPYNTTKTYSSSREAYNKGFRIIQDEISQQQVAKVVLSRQCFHHMEVTQVYDIFIALKNKYSSAFTYVIHTEQTGTWVGASPEIVLKNKGNTLLTRAIAGTKSTGNKQPWSPKEIEEHRFIETFYKEVLEKRGLPYKLSDSHTIAAGNVSHICSDITLDNSDNLIDLAAVIHPSPALSGFPKCAAMKLIDVVEPHKRTLYGGYLGPLKPNLQWFANIRCMEIFKNGLLLHVGGGITARSQLESEWEETELKSETLLSVIRELESVI